jgi:hypothetical protein
VNVLVGCEFSGTVREAFRAKGHDVWSCDLLPAEDGSAFHVQGDVMAAIASRQWDMLICHPPCTFLTVSAAWAFKDGPYHQKIKEGTLVGAARREARDKAIAFARALLECGIPKIAMENPIGALSRAIRKPDCIIHPHQFGADASKATCLWLKGLPLLKPTQNIPPRFVDGKPRWSNQTDSGQNRLSPSIDRWAKRSVTFPGIAAAMAEQWG